jgi:hypothetical protein
MYSKELCNALVYELNIRAPVVRANLHAKPTRRANIKTLEYVIIGHLWLDNCQLTVRK